MMAMTTNSSMSVNAEAALVARGRRGMGETSVQTSVQTAIGVPIDTLGGKRTRSL